MIDEVMRKIGIITIHKIPNHGSVLQAFALQKVLSMMGYNSEIIDYLFPNKYQLNQPSDKEPDDCLSIKELVLKYLFAFQILKQRNNIKRFIKNHLNLTLREYVSPDDISKETFDYDIYVSGSDQIWSTQHTKGDPSFLLGFAPDTVKKISYASSFGRAIVEDKYKASYTKLLNRFSSISVREESAVQLIDSLIGRKPTVVLDPTLLLNRNQWNEIARKERVIKGKYIFCYFLNYSFNAHPFVEKIADDFQKQTGFKLVWGIRPPKRFCNPNTIFKVGASVEEFLALIRDAEIVLTTSFHGTVFSVNYGRPLLSIVDDKYTNDNRQINILKSLGLENNILSVHDEIPSYEVAYYNDVITQQRLKTLIESSMNYLKGALI